MYAHAYANNDENYTQTALCIFVQVYMVLPVNNVRLDQMTHWSCGIFPKLWCFVDKCPIDIHIVFPTVLLFKQFWSLPRSFDDSCVGTKFHDLNIYARAVFFRSIADPATIGLTWYSQWNHRIIPEIRQAVFDIKYQGGLKSLGIATKCVG